MWLREHVQYLSLVVKTKEGSTVIFMYAFKDHNVVPWRSTGQECPELIGLNRESSLGRLRNKQWI